jgi:hypothetical protein
MKTFEAFNIDPHENLFLEISHLDELEIKFDFFEYKSTIFYLYNNNCLFGYVKSHKTFYVNRDDISKYFETSFYINKKNMVVFLESMINKYFNIYSNVIELYTAAISTINDVFNFI